MKCTNKRNRLSTDKALWRDPISFHRPCGGLSVITNMKDRVRFSILGMYSDGQKKRFMMIMAKNIWQLNHSIEDPKYESIRERERSATPLSKMSYAKRVEIQQEIDDMLEYCDFDFDFNMDI